MIILYETKLTKEQITDYHNKGYRVASIFDEPYIKQGESVGIILDKIYKTTIDFIDDLLYNNDRINITNYKPDKEGTLQKIRNKSNKVINKLTLKYGNKTYRLDSLTDWKFTHQSETDQIKTKTEYHEVYRIYLDNLKEIQIQKKQDKLEKQYELYDSGISDKELDNYVSTFAYLYDMTVDMTDKLDKMRAYKQIQYYQDNEIPYINERVINPEDEPMFQGKFKIEYEEPIEIISFGNEIYLEDFVYKNTESSCI